MEVRMSPLTRPGGHFAVSVEVDEGKIKDAKAEVVSVRAIEHIARGQVPDDLPFIASRICGESSMTLMICAAQALESAYNIEISKSARLLRNIAQGLEIIQSHIGVFYHLLLPDFIDLTKVASYDGKDPSVIEIKKKIIKLIENGDLWPLVLEPAQGKIDDPVAVSLLLKHYFEVFDLRAAIHKAMATVGGRMPMPSSVVAGGITVKTDVDTIKKLIFTVKSLIKWVNDVFLADILSIAPLLLDLGNIGKTVNFLSFGGMILDNYGEQKFFEKGVIVEKDLSTVLNFEVERIREYADSSWYTASSGGWHPSGGKTAFDMGKSGAYSFVKSAQFRKKSFETGALARLLINQDQTLLKLAKDLNIGPSVLTRIASYAIETKHIAEAILGWVVDIEPNEPGVKMKGKPPFAEGYALTEAADGSLGMWISIDKGRISDFQVITGSTWNLSPKSNKKRGPVEEALIGTDVTNEDYSKALKVIRSFAPCPRCAAH